MVYEPDNLGTAGVNNSRGNYPYATVPASVCRHLDVDEGDRIVFEESGPGEVTLSKKEGEADPDA